jgi:hypothetical protein
MEGSPVPERITIPAARRHEVWDVLVLILVSIVISVTGVLMI